MWEARTCALAHSLQVPLCPGTLTWLLSSLFPFPGLANGPFHQDIQANSAAWKTIPVYSTEAGHLPGNVRKNHCKDVLPCKLGASWGSRWRSAHISTPWQSKPPHYAPVYSLSDPCKWLHFSWAAPNCTQMGSLLGVQEPCWLSSRSLSGPKHFSHLSLWQMIRHEWSSPCSRRRDIATTSTATSSRSGWKSGKELTWWGWQQDLSGELSLYQGTDGSQAYNATQGPLPHTLLDFWHLVWEFGVKVSLRGGWGGTNILSPPLAVFLQLPNPNHSPLPLPFLSR